MSPLAHQSVVAVALKRELERTLAEKKLNAEWAQIIRGLDTLQQVECACAATASGCEANSMATPHKPCAPSMWRFPVVEILS
jgi:hypothetical protein